KNCPLPAGIKPGAARSAGGYLRQYLNLYRAVSQRDGGRKDMIGERKMFKSQPAPTASTVGPCSLPYSLFK
ncbi:MAG: hypothetical protein AB2693_24335, partial [Candidatus Thiodiazotropha sp.]